jgi:hypothetical protein
VTPITNHRDARGPRTAEATLTQDFPASWSSGDTDAARSTFDLLAANSNEPALVDTGEDDATALAQQLRDQVLQLLT